MAVRQAAASPPAASSSRRRVPAEIINGGPGAGGCPASVPVRVTAGSMAQPRPVARRPAGRAGGPPPTGGRTARPTLCSTGIVREGPGSARHQGPAIRRLRAYGQRRPGPRRRGPRRRYRDVRRPVRAYPRSTQRGDLAGLRPLLTLFDVERHALAFVEGLVAVRLDRGVVHEHVRATTVGCEEAVTLPA